MRKTVLAVAVMISAMASPGFAQDSLPAACNAAATAPMAGMHMGGMDMAKPADEAHTALMAGMDRMNAEMMAGAANPDIDVAFVCGMIPHHRGAIAMATAELQYGKDEWTKALARQIIAAQQKEIADMTIWLEQRGK